ncbi:MAG TPA: hypothetical protein VF450_11900 [Noviherbaspirillum sp.]
MISAKDEVGEKRGIEMISFFTHAVLEDSQSQFRAISSMCDKKAGIAAGFLPSL